MATSTSNNPNQAAIDKAYQEGVEQGKNEPLIATMARGAADMFITKSAMTDVERAAEQGREDARNGKV